MKYSLFDDYVSVFVHQKDLFITTYVKSILAPFNLDHQQNLIMMLLWDNDGLNQNIFAAKLQKDKANIARMIFSLEKKGLIRRETVENDRRSLKVYLTDEGKELGHKVIPVCEEFNELLTQNVSKEEIIELKRILSKLAANIERKKEQLPHTNLI